MPPDIADVLERLERLERQNERLQRQNRRLKWAGGVGAVLVVAVGLSSCTSRSQGPAVQSTVEAEKIVLKGPDGKTQALFTSSPKGPALILFPPGEPTTPSVGLMAHAEGVPEISLHDGKGRGRMPMKVEKDGETVLMMTDERGKERARFSVNGPGPGLTFWDDADQVRIALSADKTSTALALAGADRSAVILENRPELQRMVILNSKEDLRAGFVATRQGPTIGLFDDQGRVLFSKP